MTIEGKRAAALGLGLVLVFTALCYLPSLGNGFTNWDDEQYVVENGSIRDHSPTNLGKFFTSFQFGNYHPFTMLSYVLDYRLFGLDPFGWHAENLALHLLNTALLFLVARLLGGGLVSCLAAALLFGIHPVHVESVAWVSERKDVLSTLFYFGALAAYLRHRQGGRGVVFYEISLLLFICSLLSKSMAVSFPLVLVLCDWRCGRALDRKSWLEKLPFLALALAFAALAIWSQGSSGGIRMDQKHPFGDNLLIASYGLLFYLVKAVLPVGLSALYPLPQTSGGPLPLPFLLAPLGAIAVLAAAWRLARHSRAARFNILFFLVTLAPVLQLVPIGQAFAADRYLYIPSLGLCLLAGDGIGRLALRREGRPALHGRILWGALALIALVLASLTWQRTTVWKDSLTLWNDVLKKYPRSSFVAYGLRANARLGRGEFELAARDYTRGLKIFPDNPVVLIQRSRAYIGMAEAGGDRSLLDLALADLDRALELPPRLGEARYVRGYLLALRDGPAGALADLNRTVAEQPTSERAYFYRGRVLRMLGSFDMALIDFNTAIALNPADPEAYCERGNLLVDLGEPARAAADYREALRQRPDYAEAVNYHGVAAAMIGDFDRAMDDFSRAIEINPSYARAYANRGRLWSLLGQEGRAAADIARAGELGAPAPGTAQGEAPSREPAARPPLETGQGLPAR